MHKKKRSQKASILILATWILTLLTVFTLSLGFSVRQRLKLLQRLEEREQLRFIAEAGVKKAIYALHLKSAGDEADSLTDPWSTNPRYFEDIAVGGGAFTVSYEVLKGYADGVGSGANELTNKGLPERYGVVDEARKININTFTSPQILKRLIYQVARVSEPQALAIGESILDWRDEDDSRRIDGAESRYYETLKKGYRPKNGPFGGLEELLLVKGMTSDILKHIRPYLTLHGSGRININTATPQVLKAIGISSALSEKIVKYRQGDDRRFYTTDDRRFSDVGNLVEDLNEHVFMDDNEKSVLEGFVEQGLLDVSSQYFMVQSKAKFGNVDEAQFFVMAIVDREGKVIRWMESFGRAI